jgi:hypothetical protein
MSWIKNFAKGSFSLFSGQVIEGFQPLDFYHFYPLWFDLWVKRVDTVLAKQSVSSKSYAELRNLLTPPSNMRAILKKLIVSWKGLTNKQKRGSVESYRNVCNFFARMLMESCPDDPFGEKSNPLYSKEEVQKLVSKLNWQDATKDQARLVGQLITAAGSLVHGYYNDVVTDLGWETYGPYEVKFNNIEHSFLIRHFPDLQPKDLGWHTENLASFKELFIYSLYQGVEWEIGFVGCHTIAVQGSPVEGMRKYLVVADSKELSDAEIKNLIDELSRKAEAVYKNIRSLDFEKLKTLVMLQECYQFKNLFTASEIDWQPTAEMRNRIKNRPLLSGIFPHGKMMSSLSELEDTFGFKAFSREVLGEEY